MISITSESAAKWSVVRVYRVSTSATEETATSRGNSAGSINARSMTIEVSMSPRARRWSATRRGVLVDHRVDIFPKPPGCDVWRAGKSGRCSVGRYEHPLAQRDQLADRHAIACDDEGLPPVQRAHDSPALVAELPLRDFSVHNHRSL